MLGSMPVAEQLGSVTLAQLQDWVVRLRCVAELDPSGGSADGQLVDRIAVLEQMKSACAAGQAELSAGLLTYRLAEQQCRGAIR